MLSVDGLAVELVDIDLRHLPEPVDESRSYGIGVRRSGNRGKQFTHRLPRVRIATEPPLAVEDVEGIPKHSVAGLVRTVTADGPSFMPAINSSTCPSRAQQ